MASAGYGVASGDSPRNDTSEVGEDVDEPFHSRWRNPKTEKDLWWTFDGGAFPFIVPEQEGSRDVCPSFGPALRETSPTFLETVLSHRGRPDPTRPLSGKRRLRT